MHPCCVDRTLTSFPLSWSNKTLTVQVGPRLASWAQAAKDTGESKTAKDTGENKLQRKCLTACSPLEGRPGRPAALLLPAPRTERARSSPPGGTPALHKGWTERSRQAHPDGCVDVSVQAVTSAKAQSLQRSHRLRTQTAPLTRMAVSTSKCSDSRVMLPSPCGARAERNHPVESGHC